MAYSNVGAIEAASAGTPITASWDPPKGGANWISIYADSQKVTFTIQPDPDDDGTPMHVQSGTTVTMRFKNFSGFTITRPVATAVDVYWWD